VKTNLIGPKLFVREPIGVYRETSVTMLDLKPAGPDPVAAMEKVRGWL
jgi:hypothetical protein